MKVKYMHLRKSHEKAKKGRLKASITVYLTGVMLVMLSLIMMLVSVSKHVAVKAESVAIVNMSMDSVFAEYNRELLESYDLFFIDTGYGGKEIGKGKLKNHLLDYLTKNTNVQEEVLLWNYKDFLNLKLDSAEIISASLATDNKGKDLKYQAIEYIRDLTGLELIDDVQNQYNEAYSSGMLTQDVSAMLEEKRAEVDAQEKPQIQNEDGEYVDAPISIPTDDVTRNIFSELIKRMMKKGESISDKTANFDGCVSKRTLEKGDGAFYAAEEFDLIDEILFDEYILDKCGAYLDEKEGNLLSYETEYILVGSESDKDNFTSVVMELHGVRWVTDFAYILTDSSKTGKAAEVAGSIPFIGQYTALKKSLEGLILIGWAYMEALSDTRRLLQGWKVPLIKDQADWVVPYEACFNLIPTLESTDKSYSGGLDYKGYLRVLLLTRGADEKVMRLMNLIETRVRQTKGNQNFRLDGCVDAMTAQITLNGNGEDITITRTYDYMSR